MTFTVQPHIHLSETVSSAPEFSPDMKWKGRVDAWGVTPLIISDHRRTLTGRLKKHVLSTTGGDVIQFKEYRYTVRVDDYWGFTAEQRFSALLSMHGKSVKLIDVIHPVEDEQNHAPYVLDMWCSLVTDVTQINPQLTPIYVGIELLDDYTVT